MQHLATRVLFTHYIMAYRAVICYTTDLHTILMEEGNCLVEFPGIGYDVFGVVSEQRLLYDGRIAFLFALDG